MEGATLRGLITAALELKSKGYSNRAIAAELNLPENIINRLLKRG